MEIALFELENWEREKFAALAEGNILNLVSDRLDLDNVGDYSGSEIISTFVYSELGDEVLRRLPALKMIATRSTGFDHIDIDYCRDHDIVIANVPAYGENTVAEHVFGLLLSISHHLYEAVDRTRKGDFSLQGLEGFDLQGRTLGVIGTGSIGRNVIRIGHGFGMEVLAYDARPRPAAEAELGFRLVALDELLSRSDVITLHVPALPQTRNLLAAREFGLMKRGVVIINTSRGSVIDHDALLRALADGTVRAAGLDVLPEEPTIREEAELLRSYFQRRHDFGALLANHILLRMRNVIITPHSAFYTREAINRILDTTHDNIDAFIAGQPRNLVH